MHAPDVVDVVALGESVVTFLPTRPGRLADAPSFEGGIGGAESNAALDDDVWGRLRLAPGWTDIPDQAEEEVPTP